MADASAAKTSAAETSAAETSAAETAASAPPLAAPGIPAADPSLQRPLWVIIGVATVCGLLAGLLFRVWVIPIELVRHLIAHFTAVPLFMVGFAYGTRAMLYAAVVATAAATAVRVEPWQPRAQWDDSQFWYAVVYWLLIALPAVILVWRSIRLRTDKHDMGEVSRFSRVFLELLVYYLVVVMAAMLIIHVNHSQGAIEWMYQQLLSYLYFALSEPLTEMLRPMMAEQLAAQGMEPTEMVIDMGTTTAVFSALRLTSLTASFHAPGALAAAVIALGLMNARVGLSGAGWLTQRPQVAPDMLDLALPKWVPLVFVAAVVLRVFAYDIGQWLGDERTPSAYLSAFALIRFFTLSLAWMLLLPILLAGYAVIHLAVRGRRYHPLIVLVPVYGLVVPALGAILLGLLDPFTKWRERHRKRLAAQSLRQAYG